MNSPRFTLPDCPKKWTPPANYPKVSDPANAPPLWLVDLYSHEIPKESGAAFVWMDGEFLHAVCVMKDSYPHSDAELKGAFTWEKGDVMELFFMPDSCAAPYYEFHITPNQATLEMAIPDAAKLRAGEIPFHDLFIDSGMTAEAEISPDGWRGHIQIPRTLFETQLNPDAPPKFAVCRYNYGRDSTQPPELSATCVYPIPKFHLPEVWHFLRG